MNKSEQLRKEAGEVESDSKALGLLTKALREQRNEKFDEKWLSIFKEQFGDKFLWIEKMYCYRIMHENGIDYTDYYPKANKIFIRHLNKWIKPGLQYLVKHYLDHPKNADNANG
jgi:hypothetical protein